MASKDTAFGRALDDVLGKRGIKQKQFAARIGTSSAYVSAIATGKTSVSPARIDTVSEALDLDAEETRRLHRAAALDAGFRLDLPDDF